MGAANVVDMAVRKDDRRDLSGIKPQPLNVFYDGIGIHPCARINEHQLPKVHQVYRAIPWICYFGASNKINTFYDLLRFHREPLSKRVSVSRSLERV